jgi:hypothetical protein
MEIADRYRETVRALPTGWRLEGLRCASSGLDPELRSERWIAEACGPNGECFQLEEESPHHALRTLAAQLRERRGQPAS